MSDTDVVCTALVVFVPLAIAPEATQARVRAGFFAQYGAHIRTPIIDEPKRVDEPRPGWKVRIRAV